MKEPSGDRPPTNQAPTTTVLLELDREIAKRLRAMQVQVGPIGLASKLAPAVAARTARGPRLATADVAARPQWLSTLQFQHAQLLAISPRLGPLVASYLPLASIPHGYVDENQRQQRAHLRSLLVRHLAAAAVSHDRDVSTGLLSAIVAEEKAAARQELDAAQVDFLDAGRDVSGGGTVRDVEAAESELQRRRESQYNGGTGRSREADQQTITKAGEIALRSRILKVYGAIAGLRAAADEVFPDPAALRRLVPTVKTLPDVLATVAHRLDEVERTWTDATREGTPEIQTASHMPDGAEWEGRAKGLGAARAAFTRIAGDKDIGSFLREAASKIEDQRFYNAITSFAAALLITLATGMGAAALGRAAATALVGESQLLAAQLARLAIDVSVNTSINTAVQLAQSGGHGSVGWIALENGLMELFTRGMMRKIKSVETAAVKEAREFASLPGLTAGERTLLSSPSFAGLHLVADTVGGMAAQWAANRLVQTFQESGQEASEPFALTVLQQGAALGLGKFFAGRHAAWQRHRQQLAQTRIGKLPEAHALFAARETFYARAKRLAEHPSPDPAEGPALQQQDVVLLRGERVILTRLQDGGERNAGTKARTPPIGRQAVSDTHGRSAWATTAEPGLLATETTIADGTVRMEAHPDYDRVMNEVQAKGFVVRRGTNARVANVHVVDERGNLLEVHKELHVIEGMRFLDLEHELGHIRQLDRFSAAPATEKRVLQQGRLSRAKGNLAEGQFTSRQNAVVEYHNRLDEYVRLAERNVSKDILRAHAEGLDRWRIEAETGGLGFARSSIHGWAKRHFVEIPILESRVRELGVPLRETNRW